MATSVEYGLVAALVVVVGITGWTATHPDAPPPIKHRIPVCPSGTAYVPITEMCIPGAANPVRWEWR